MEDLELQQSITDDLKMDQLAQDMSDLHSESDPMEIIRLLYSNMLTVITKLLARHFTEVKVAAVKYCQLDLHREVISESSIASVNSIQSLFSQMSVMTMWDNTRFLRKAVASIPISAPERSVAEAILSHYSMHLSVHKHATILKDALAKKSKSEEKGKTPWEDPKLVPLKITSLKAFED